MSRKVRTIYNAEFKEDAVKLVINQGYKVEEAADRLGVSKSALGKWVRAKRIERSDSGLSFSEKEELNRLRKALKRAEMERDILKKAAAFFAQEQL
jgi:transposase